MSYYLIKHDALVFCLYLMLIIYWLITTTTMTNSAIVALNLAYRINVIS